MTAEEFVRSLAADPEYRARMAALEASTDELGRACAGDEAVLLEALRTVGAKVSSVYDFVNADGAPPIAIPILLAHLRLQRHPRIWEGIVRSLSVKHAHAAALPTLVELYSVEQDRDRRWVLANAIGSMAKFAEVAHLDGIDEYRPLFRQSRKRSSRPSA
ncbi:MAG: hypothetical protein ACR2M1_11915 [Gemmatimonadaceae bacterium]